MRRKEVSAECKYSPSCFTCPLNDCAAYENVAQLNSLPYDGETLKALSDEAQRCRRWRKDRKWENK